MENLPLVVANFKANKSWEEVSAWTEEVSPKAQSFPGTIVLAPSMAFINQTSWKIQSEKANIKVASQDISKFEQGAYTGEVAASQIKGQITYCIIGHSERRQNFGEDDQILGQKVKNAIAAGIEPIFCVQDENTMIPQGVKIVAYEPVFAIGTGKPDTSENAEAVAQSIKAKGDFMVLYGGSVTGDNAKSFLKAGVIDGLLVGSASLDPQSFLKIVEAI